MYRNSYKKATHYKVGDKVRVGYYGGFLSQVYRKKGFSTIVLRVLTLTYNDVREGWRKKLPPKEAIQIRW